MPLIHLIFRLRYLFICVALLPLGMPEAASQGINFLPTEFTKLITQAKQQNKLAFVEIYLKGCTHCEALAPVLEEKQVGDYYNTTFVNMKMEANSAMARSLQEKKKLYFPEFPLLLYFDGNGELLHQTTPMHKPTRAENIQDIINEGKKAGDPAQRTSGYPARFAKGDRDPIFLIDYGKYTRTIRDTTQQLKINEELAKIFKDPINSESPSGFYVLSRLINDFQNPMAQYFFTHLDTYKTKFGEKETQQVGENILYQTLYGIRKSELPSTEVIAIRNAMVSLGLEVNMAENRTILKELESFFRENATDKATSRFSEYRSTRALSLIDYAYIMRYFNQQAPDHSYASELVGWINQVLQQIKPADQNRGEVAELYRELSEGYLRIGNREEGKKAAEKALAIAKTAQEKLDTYERQLGKF